MATQQPTALRKRQQITRANQTMFLVIAGVSVIVGFSIVLVIFLGQKIWFNEKVLIEKNNTIATLEKNINAVPELKENVSLLNTNEALRSTRLKESDPAIQSVLDALPADANSTAMAASLQNKLLNNVPGVTLESLKVEPVSGIETDQTAETITTSGSTSTNAIGFSFSVSTANTTQDSLRQVLTRIEKSIRPFNITTLNVEGQGNRIVMTATGVGYYMPAQKLQLTDKVVRP